LKNTKFPISLKNIRIPKFVEKYKNTQFGRKISESPSLLKNTTIPNLVENPIRLKNIRIPKFVEKYKNPQFD
jgi:hypothetical protein